MINLNKNEYTPDYISPPGETLYDIIFAAGISKKSLAKKIEQSIELIDNIIEGKDIITLRSPSGKAHGFSRGMKARNIIQRKEGIIS